MEIYDVSLLFYGGYVAPNNSDSTPLADSASQLDKSKRIPREADFHMKYKTEICRNWESGYCEFGDRCAFAHGYDELRQKTHITTNYKTRPCKQFYELGYCMYGKRCQFKHKEDSDDSDTRTASNSPPHSVKNSRDSSVESSSKRRLPIFVVLEQKGGKEI